MTKIHLNSAKGFRNPLVVFGMILLAGDGPLVTAYCLTSDSARAWALLLASVLFVFGMGAFFCYLVVAKPRHLYSPREIPESAFNKNIFKEKATAVSKEIDEKLAVMTQELVKDLISELRSTGTTKETIAKVTPIAQNLLNKGLKQTRKIEANTSRKIETIYLGRQISYSLDYRSLSLGEIYELWSRFYDDEMIRDALIHEFREDHLEADGELIDSATIVSQTRDYSEKRAEIRDIIRSGSPE